MDKIQGMIVLIVLLAGCTVRRHSTYERTAWQTDTQETTMHERQLRQQERAAVASIRMEYANSTAEIVPLGTFRLTPDSGFIGEADRVVISQKNRNLQAAASNVETSKTDSSAATAATREHTAFQRDTRMRHQQADVSPLWKIPWWVWLGVIGVVIYFFRRFRKW